MKTRMLRNIRNQEKLYTVCANKKFGTELYTICTNVS